MLLADQNTAVVFKLLKYVLLVVINKMFVHIIRPNKSTTVAEYNVAERMSSSVPRVTCVDVLVGTEDSSQLNVTECTLDKMVKKTARPKCVARTSEQTRGFALSQSWI